MMEHRAIVIDPYTREISELQTEGDYKEILRLISNDEGNKPCRMFSSINFGGGTTGYVDDEGNWSQFAWFSLILDKRLFCGRMVMIGGDHEGNSANLDAGITTESVMDKVIWLDDAGALEQAKTYTDAMAESASASAIPVISLDTGLIERIGEAIANKERKRFTQIEDREYRAVPEADDWGHVGAVYVYDCGFKTRRLPECHEHVNHSPDGFGWGYGGSGAAQLAFAILYDVTGELDKSLRLYQQYKWAVVAKLPKKPWTIGAQRVWDWVDEADSASVATLKAVD